MYTPKSPEVWEGGSENFSGEGGGRFVWPLEEGVPKRKPVGGEGGQNLSKFDAESCWGEGGVVSVVHKFSSWEDGFSPGWGGIPPHGPV